MINTLNDLRLKWREREVRLKQITFGIKPTDDFDREPAARELMAQQRCTAELLAAIDSVQPRPLNEASTETLYHWSGRMIAILDRVQQTQGIDEGYDNWFVSDMTTLCSPEFINDVYPLFKELANRQSGA